MGAYEVLPNGERTRLDAFVEAPSTALEGTLDGLTEEQARRRLVSPSTRLLQKISEFHRLCQQGIVDPRCIFAEIPQHLAKMVHGDHEEMHVSPEDRLRSIHLRCQSH